MAMNLELPDEINDRLDQEVEEGRFTSKSEAIRAALRRMFDI